MSPRIRALRRVVGLALTAIAVVVILRSFPDPATLREELAGLPSHAFALSVAIYAGVLGLEAWIWRDELLKLDPEASRLSRLECLEIFAFSNLAKYVPGRVWLFVTQSSMMLSRRLSLKTSAALSLLLNTYVLCGAILLLCLCAIFLPLPVWIKAAAAAGAAILLVLPDIFVRIPIPSLQSFSSALRPRYRGRLLAFGVIWALHGVAALVFLKGAVSSGSSDWGAGVQCIAGNVASWLAGVVAFFMPAGLGAREAVFYLAVDRLPEETRVVLPLATRVCLVGADLAVFAVVGAFSLRARLATRRLAR